MTASPTTGAWVSRGPSCPAIGNHQYHPDPPKTETRRQERAKKCSESRDSQNVGDLPAEKCPQALFYREWTCELSMYPEEAQQRRALLPDRRFVNLSVCPIFSSSTFLWPQQPRTPPCLSLPFLTVPCILLSSSFALTHTNCPPGVNFPKQLSSLPQRLELPNLADFQNQRGGGWGGGTDKQGQFLASPIKDNIKFPPKLAPELAVAPNFG